MGTWGTACSSTATVQGNASEPRMTVPARLRALKRFGAQARSRFGEGKAQMAQMRSLPFAKALT